MKPLRIICRQQAVGHTSAKKLVSEYFCYYVYQMKRLFPLLFMLLNSLDANCYAASPSQDTVAQKFVSVDCDKGDITLTLCPGGHFVLVLDYWDENSLEHTHKDSIFGQWIKIDSLLILKSAASELRYLTVTDKTTIDSTTIELNGYSWFSSTPATPFDTYLLDEKEKLEKFLLEKAKKMFPGLIPRPF
jgi:hypothetical protein